MYWNPIYLNSDRFYINNSDYDDGYSSGKREMSRRLSKVRKDWNKFKALMTLEREVSCPKRDNTFVFKDNESDLRYVVL